MSADRNAGRVRAVWAVVGCLFVVGYVMNGSEDADAWALLFWLSAIANVLQLMAGGRR